MKKIGEVALTQSQRNKRHYSKHREAELARNKEYYATYYPENRDRIKAGRRNRRHGITQEWFNRKVKEQNNCCALCLKPFAKTPNIDHDHGCCPPLKSCDDCRRDLLCDDCNLGLGRLKDDVELLTRAIAYVRKHKERNTDVCSVQHTEVWARRSRRPY